MSRADPVEVDDMVLLLVPVLAQQPSEVRRADREHEGVCRQKLVVGAIPTSKGDICQLFQLDKLLHKDEERLMMIVPLQQKFFIGGHFYVSSAPGPDPNGQLSLELPFR